MPYIVTTKGPAAPVSRAAATLDEARTHSREQVRDAVTNRDARGRLLAGIDWLDEDGGSVGLPSDATVIEVEHVTSAELYDDVYPDHPYGPGYERPHPDDTDATDALIVAFNTRHGSA